MAKCKRTKIENTTQ